MSRTFPICCLCSQIFLREKANEPEIVYYRCEPEEFDYKWPDDDPFAVPVRVAAVSEKGKRGA